jgi:hypothetical protein
MDQGGHDVLEHEAVGNPRAMTAQRMGQRHDGPLR